MSTLALTAKSIAILVLSTEAAGYQLSEVHDAVRTSIERHTDLTVRSMDVFRDSAAIRACAGDGRCFARIARTSGGQVDLLLTLSLDALGQGGLLGIRLLDVRATGDDSPNIASLGEELPAGLSLLRAIDGYLARVFPGPMWGVVGGLTIEADRPSAEVLIDNQTCVTPCARTRMREGAYTVLVKKKGYLPWRDTVTVESGRTVAVVAELVAEDAPLWHSPWFWGGVGAGAVAVGTVIFFVARPDPGPGTICIADVASKCQ